MLKLALVIGFLEIIPFHLTEVFEIPISLRMRRAKIVPDLILFPPNEVCNVTFAKNITEVTGWPIFYGDTLGKPNVTWNCDEKSYYVLSMTNIDVPNKKYSEENFKEWHCWLVYNIPGCRVEEGIELFPHKDSFPPQYDMDQRLVFLVWKQPAKFKGMRLDPKIFENKFTPPRAMLEVEKYLSLFGIGNAIAGNYFLVV